MANGVTTAISRGVAELTVKLITRAPKTRCVYRLAALCPPICFGVHASNLTNLRRAIVERVFYVEKAGQLTPPPRPQPGVFTTKLAGFRSAMLPRLSKLAPVSYEEFVDGYTGRRRTIYEAAVETLRSRAVEWRDSWIVKAFVKAEKVNLTKKPDPAPRIIQPRSPRYNVEVGRYIRHMEKHIYRAIGDVFGEITVLKGYNAHQSGAILRSKWERFKDPVAVGLDASRFDQHVSEAALRWEHGIYLASVPSGERRTLSRLLRWQLYNKCRGIATDGTIKYRTVGCRMSGDMNTSLGNCLLMCAMVYSYLEERGVVASLANNGDDCVVIMERASLKRFQTGLGEWFLECGFDIKVEPPVDVFERIEFCQTHPIFDGTRWLMVRNCPTAIAKDCHSIVCLTNEQQFRKWCGAIGACGMSLTGGIPIFQSFYGCLLRGAGGEAMGAHPALDTGFARLAAGMDRVQGEISQDARFSFWLGFGITPAQQVAIESYYDSCSIQYHPPIPLEQRDINHCLPNWF